MQELQGKWYHVTVYDAESNSTTEVDKFITVDYTFQDATEELQELCWEVVSFTEDLSP